VDKGDEVTGGWKNLHNGDIIKCLLSTEYDCVARVKKDEMGGICSTHRSEKYVYRFG
jgi:hypothetical protein